MTADRTADESTNRDGDSTARRKSSRREIFGSGVPPWSRAFGAALFVIGVTATFSYVMSEDPVERGDIVIGAFTDQFIDDFERPSSSSLGRGPGVSWNDEVGTWAIEIGVVYLPDPDPSFNVVTTDAGSPEMSISANVGGGGLCGVTVRYQDPNNYVALLRASGFGVWNIVEVVNGKERSLGTVSDVASTNVTVRLDIGPNLVTAVVGLFRTQLSVDVPLTGTKMGLIARGGAMETCTWDDTVGRLAN